MELSLRLNRATEITSDFYLHIQHENLFSTGARILKRKKEKKRIDSVREFCACVAHCECREQEFRATKIKD